MFAGFTLIVTAAAAAAVLAGAPVAATFDGFAGFGGADGTGRTPAPAQTASSPEAQTTAPAPAGAPVTPSQGRPTLGGIWKLNPAQTDAPRTAPEGGRSRFGGGRPSGGGGMGRGGGMGGGRTGGGGVGGGAYPDTGGDPARAKEVQAQLQELMQLPPTLTVSEGDGTATFTYPDGRSVTYRTDGSKEKHQAVNATVETRTQWEEAGLVVETDLGHDLKARQVYSVTADPRQLVVLVSFGGGRSGRQPHARRVVYDDVTAASQP